MSAHRVRLRGRGPDERGGLREDHAARRTDNALFSSDVGHFDVVDMRDPLPEAYELVENGPLSRAIFCLEPRRVQDGKLAITLPIGEARMPGIAAEDIGKCAYGIFKQGAEAIGKTIGIAGEHLTGAQTAEAMAESLGEPVGYNAVTPEAFRGFGFPGAEDLGNMFQFKRDFEKDFCNARSIEVSRVLNPELQLFRTWPARDAKKMPVE
jgi:hypothetical protein